MMNKGNKGAGIKVSGTFFGEIWGHPRRGRKLKIKMPREGRQFD